VSRPETVGNGIRDPLSVRYANSARKLILAGIRARPATAAMFVVSPPREFLFLDGGSKFRLTKHERAMMRAVYYQVNKIPPKRWSVKITMGRIEKRHGRWGRPMHVRMYTAGSGYNHAEKNTRTSYVQRPELRNTAEEAV